MQANPDGLPIPQRYWAVLTISLGLVMAVLDGAIANIALPTIAHDLVASPADSIWVVNAYQLAVTISLLPLASLGDIFGYRRVFLTGLIVFTVASLGCAIATTLFALTVARVFQGFGAAGIMSVNVALLRFIYPRSWIGRGSVSTQWSARSPPRSGRPSRPPSFPSRIGRGCSRSMFRRASSPSWSA